MRHLIEGLHSLQTAIDAGSPPEIPVSAEFCDAMANLCRQCGGGTVHVQVQWSPAVRENIPAVSDVRLSGGYEVFPDLPSCHASVK